MLFEMRHKFALLFLSLQIYFGIYHLCIKISLWLILMLNWYNIAFEPLNFPSSKYSYYTRKGTYLQPIVIIIPERVQLLNQSLFLYPKRYNLAIWKTFNKIGKKSSSIGWIKIYGWKYWPKPGFFYRKKRKVKCKGW